MVEQNIDLAILVALAEEFEELLRNVYGEIDILRDPEYGSYYYRFRLHTLHSAPIEVVACFIGGMGPDRAGRQMERLLHRWSPTITVLIGICGAIHGDVSLCDVIVSSRVDAYLSTTKVVPTSEDHFDFEHRGLEYECDYELVEEARNFIFAHKDVYERWQQDCSDRASVLLSDNIDLLTRQGLVSHRPRIHVGHIASGPIVSAAASFGTWLRKRNSDIIAIEMEAAGVASAAGERISRARFISLRGVSDLSDERKADLDRVGAGALRTLAMSNALELLRLLVFVGTFSRRETKRIQGLEFPDVERPLNVPIQAIDLPGTITSWMLRPSNANHDISGLRILVVDDDVDIRESYCQFCTFMGAEALSASSGEKALELLENDNRFHVVVTDIMMAGMDGLEFASYVLKNWPNLPLIVISGWMAPSELSLSNCYDFLSKPVQFEDLKATIAEVCYDRQRKMISEGVPDLRIWFYALYECKRKITEFMCNFSGLGLFETAFRHKLKDSIAKFSKSIVAGASPKIAIGKLTHELGKLSMLLKSSTKDISASLSSFCESFAKDVQKQHRNIDITLEIDSKLQMQMRQDIVSLIYIALIELVDNAIEALSGSGEIRVSLHQLEVRQVILIKVWSATGPLDSAVAAKIFEEGFSTKGPERGMGLSIIRKLAERFGGRFEFSQNGGVEFILSLPFLRPTE